MDIQFNIPYLTGKESERISRCIQGGKLCGNGPFTRECERVFDRLTGGMSLMTSSCTDALEMCALLAGIKPGDEVIVPSYTFVSSALAFVRQGAVIRFADSLPDSPNIDASEIDRLVTERTRAVVVVHYGGVACDMDAIMSKAGKYGLTVVEDAAQAIDSYYKGRPLGSIGDLSAFSFHETKNIQCGEGGMLVINKDSMKHRAEILREKGTNRSEFFRGEVNKYGWVDTGSSFLAPEYAAAFLSAQLEEMEAIQRRRKEIWHRYDRSLRASRLPVTLPSIPDGATVNGHVYWLVTRTARERDGLIAFLKQRGIRATFHYLSLHKSRYAMDRGWDRDNLPNADRYTDCLVRLPLYCDLKDNQVDIICEAVKDYYNTVE